MTRTRLTGRAIRHRAALWLLSVLALAGRPCRGADTDALALALQSADPDTARAALDKLLAAGDEGTRRARSVLADLVRNRAATLAAARKIWHDRFAACLDAEKSKPVFDRVDQHAKAGREVLAFAMSNQTYPDTGKAKSGWRPGKDYQKGQLLLEGRTEIAVGHYNRLEVALVKSLGGVLGAGPPGGGGHGRAYLAGTLKDSGQPVPVLTYNLADPLTAWGQIAAALTRHRDRYRKAHAAWELAQQLAAKAGAPVAKAPPPAPSEPLVEAGTALLAGEFAEALKLRPPGSAPERRWFDVLLHRGILLRNARANDTGTGPERKALHEINLYRLSVALPPLVANAKIYAAAREHTLWQVRNHKVGHGRPEQDKLTVFHRCHAAGYRGPSSENIAGTHRTTALWIWRADASHHRSMILTKIHAGAVARSGRIVTYNAGWLVEDPALRELLGAASGSRMRFAPARPAR